MLVARFLVGFGSGISKYLSLSLLLFVISFFSLINVFNTHMFIGCVAVCRAYCAENTDIRNKVCQQY